MESNNPGSLLDYEPKDRPAFETHRSKTEAVETLKEELEEILEYSNLVEQCLTESQRQLTMLRNTNADLKFRLNALLTGQFESDE